MFVTLIDVGRPGGRPNVKGVQISEFGKVLLVESGILGSGIRNKAQGYRNAT